MDVSVCVYHEKTQKLRFAGAKSSMYCVNTESFSELKGDRKSVGGMQEKNEERLFTPSEVNVRSGTVFYMFTDGYRDQFGGENNRKYMSANFRNLLSSVHHLPVAEQEKVLLIAHNEWRAEREQTDDILLLGFRF
jgi:serine phosphatase RsbU (regulator of sigma subunit)